MQGGIQLAPLLTEIKVDIKGFKDDLSKASVIGKSEADKISNQLVGTAKAGKSLSGVGSKLTKGLTGLLTGVGIAAGKMAMDFESSFAQVSTLLDSNVVNFTDYKNQLLDASTESKIAVGEFSDSVYESISAGVDQTKAIGFTTDAMKLAKGGFTDGAKAVDVLTTAINGYGLKTEDATKISDMLITTQNLGKTKVDELAASMGTVIPVANGANFEINELSAAYAQLTKNGIATAESGTYLKSMLSELTTYGSKTDKALRELTGKGFAGLKEEGKSTTDILSLLGENAEKSGMTLKDMFGSAEAGSAALVLMKGDGAEYDEMLRAMGDSAGATQEAFDKIDTTPAEQLKGALNALKNEGIKLGVELIPVVTKIAGGLTKVADAFNNLSEEQRENIIKWGALALVAGPALKLVGGGITTFVKLKSALGGTSKALGVFKKSTNVAKFATTGLSTAAGLAGGGAGMGALVTGLGGAVVAAAPFALAIAGVGAVAYGVHKTMSKDVVPTVDLFADKVTTTSKIVGTSYQGMATGIKTETVKISDSTKTAVQSYLDMDTNITKSLYDQKVNQTIVTDQIASDMIGKFSAMGENIKQAENTKYQERTASLTNFLATNSALTEAEEIQIMQKEALNHEQKIATINQNQARINEIYTLAIDQRRETTEQEKLEISGIQEQMRTDAINTLSATEEEAAVIRERMKEYQGRITTEMASEMIIQANKARDGEIKAAKAKYDETIRQAARLKEAGTITKTLYDKMVTDAQTTRDGQIEAAKKGCEGVKQEIIDATPGIEDEINTQTGKIMSAYESVTTSLKGFFSWLAKKSGDAGNTLQKVRSNGRVNSFSYSGLSYVPFDGYTARLHKGERVLTAEENKEYNRDGGSNAPIYLYTTVEIDKNVAGRSLTPVISKELAFATRGGI